MSPGVQVLREKALCNVDDVLENILIVLESIQLQTDEAIVQPLYDIFFRKNVKLIQTKNIVYNQSCLF